MGTQASGNRSGAGRGARGHGRRPAAVHRGLRRAGSALALAVCALVSPEPTVVRPSELVIEPDVRARLQVLATALQSEIVLCLRGRAQGETGRVTHLYMPVPHASTATAVVTGPCPRGTLATWHNHPSSAAGRRAGGRAEAPKGQVSGPDGWSAAGGGVSCRPSSRDVSTAVRLRLPFLVIADGAGNQCVWSLEQLETLAD